MISLVQSNQSLTLIKIAFGLVAPVDISRRSALGGDERKTVADVRT